MVGERGAARGGHGVEPDARGVVAVVEAETERQLVGQPAEDGDRVAVPRVGADEVDGAGGEPAGDQERDDDEQHEDGQRLETTALATPGWLAGRSRCTPDLPVAGPDRLQRDRARATIRRLLLVRGRHRLRRALARRRLAFERVVLQRGHALGVAAPVLDVLEPEEDHGDVVAAAGLVGGRDQLAPERLERAARLEDRLQARLRHHRGEAVRAQQDEVAVAGGEGLDVDLDARLGPERTRDDRALRVRLGLLLGQLAACDQLLDERVVAREPDQVAVAEQVGPGVADMGDHDGVRRHVGRRGRGAHPGPLRVRARGVVDPAVRGLDDLDQRLGRVAPVRQPALELAHGQLRGDLAGLGPAHPVGDDEQGRADEVVVLVALALAAEVGVLEVVGDAQHQRSKVKSESPMRMRSPSCRGCAPRRGSPFR